MLNIFYGRESVDKEKFIYEKIAEKQARTLVIVPDQYTLEGEKQAFRLLRMKGLMNVEIVSMSRLGGRLIAEQGGGNRTFIDKYGRHMLLTRILREMDDDLEVFRGKVKKNAFIEMTNNFISEMKQYNVTPDDIAALACCGRGDVGHAGDAENAGDAESAGDSGNTGGDEGTEASERADDVCAADNAQGENGGGNLLSRKLSDLHKIFAAYEEKIAGKYTDSEDYIDLYMSKIKDSRLIKGADIWVYGFDSFAPKALAVLGNLMAAAEEVNVFLTYDRYCADEEIFQLPGIVMANLEKQADAFGISHRRTRVERKDYPHENKAAAIEAIEQQLYAVSRYAASSSEGITLVEAANMYNEAESAASYILHLLRDCGLRYRDILVICNDQNVRASIISRVFGEYGIGLFDDRKRSIMNSPIAVFVVAFLEVVSGGYQTRDIFKLLKTGLSDLSDEEIEELENYAAKYRVKGAMWKKPFFRGQLEYGADGLARIEDIRSRAMVQFTAFEEIYKHAATVREFIEGYYDFLVGPAALGEKITALIEMQESQGLMDLAEETRQIWGLIVGLFDQIAELSGDESLSESDLGELLITGLSQLEVGVLPPTSDDILMGTMQRSRSGQVKAVLVIGANEGLIPANVTDEGLFSIEELEHLAADGRELCKVEKVRQMEEKLAIYRNLSKPSAFLWMSYSSSDADGREMRPSEIFTSLQKIFPDIVVQKDVINRIDMKEILGGKTNTLRHLTEALAAAKKGEKIPAEWKEVYQWFLKNDRENLEKVLDGLEFTNVQQDLPKELAELLYKREDKGSEPLTVSPSRLEKFSRCPFAHFISYGLRPDEGRVYEAGSREIGDIYHECLMEISRKLTKEDRWDEVSEEECRNVVAEIVEKESGSYREGLFQFSNEERYRAGRIEDACFYVCWALIEQVRAGSIKQSLYEVPFGNGKLIPSVEIDCAGEKVCISGKIDRLDVLDEDRIKIIDYKTGNEHFDMEEARGGYRLQLMLYLKAAQEGAKKPAGVFYFHIDEPQVDLTDIDREKISDKISSEMRKFFKLDGIMVNDSHVINSIAGEFEGYSDIVPLHSKKDGTIKGTSDGVLVSEEEFEELQKDVDVQIEKLCSQLADGRIAIHPKKTDKQSACTYCPYKGICRFDTEFSGCNYEVIK